MSATGEITVKCIKWAFSLALTLTLIPVSLWAQGSEEAKEVVTADGCKFFDIQIDFSAGVLEIAPADIPELLKLDVYYTPRSVRYSVEKTERPDRCDVLLVSERRRSWSDDDSDNEWTIQLSKKHTSSLELEIGACEARMDLGGIPLSELVMDIGAAELELDFSEPNPVPMKELSVDCGASSMEITGLVNANARFMSFDIGAGSCEIDLRGEIKGEVEIEVSVGVGSMDIILPQDVAVMVDGDEDWLSTLDFSGLDLEETRRGTWETDGFSKATNRVIINADVAMGSISIYARR
jgi:hypothetical protein